jgi:putative transposase
LQGRYKALLIERESYLLELCRYVVLNPVRAGMVRSAREYHWSSYRATAGWRVPPGLLCTDWMLAQCGAERV